MRRGGYDGDVQTVRITAWVYVVFCMVLLPGAVLFGPTQGVPRPHPAPLFAACALFSAALLTILRGKRLGYYCCFVLSLLILSGVPIGTILGWNMLRAMRRSRSRLIGSSGNHTGRVRS